MFGHNVAFDNPAAQMLGTGRMSRFKLVVLANVDQFCAVFNTFERLGDRDFANTGTSLLNQLQKFLGMVHIPVVYCNPSQNRER